MASTAVSVPKYRHHKGSGQAFVQVKGKRFYLGVYGTPDSKERYSRFIAELASTPRPSIAPVHDAGADTITVVEVADAYWAHAQEYYRKKDGSPSGWLKHIHLVLNTHLGGLYGRTPAAEFGPKAFKAIRETLVRKGHSRNYVNKLMAIVPRVFKWAAAEELVPASVWHSLRTVEGLKRGRTTARETAPVQPVADTTVDATMPNLPPIVADMVRLQRLTGARPGEVCQLRPMDLDRSSNVWLYRPASHKTEYHGRDRIIYIGPKAQDVLRPYLLRAADACCFSPAETLQKQLEVRHEARKTPLRYGNRPGTNRKRKPRRAPSDHYTKDAYRRAIARGCEVAFQMPGHLRKLPKDATADQKLAIRTAATAWRKEHCWHPNQLRHTAATEIRRQYGLEAAQVVLGHAKADVTQVYAERDAALGVAVMAKIG